MQYVITKIKEGNNKYIKLTYIIYEIYYGIFQGKNCQTQLK